MVLVRHQAYRASSKEEDEWVKEILLEEGA